MSRKKMDPNVDPEEEIQQELSDEEREEYQKAEERRKNIKTAGTADVDTWITFIEEFTKDFEILDRKTKERTRNSITVYKEQLAHMVDKRFDDNNRFNHLASKKDTETALFVIDFADLQLWAEKHKDYEDESHNFGRLIESLAVDPENTLNFLRIAVYDRLSGLYAQFARDIEHKLVCTIRNYPELKELPDLNSDAINRMYRMEGLIISFDEAPHQKTTETFWECTACNMVMNRKDSAKPPLKCYNCGKHNFKEQTQMRRTIDWIHLRLQQRNDRTVEGRMAVDKLVKLEGTELVKYFFNNIPGSAYVSITGIVKFGGKGLLGDTEIECKWIDVIPETELIEEDEVLDEVVSQEIPEEQMDAHYEKICRSICHTIKGHDHIKEALAILLAGSEPITRTDYSRVRGTISMLVVGDSSEGKSDFGRFVARVAPRSVLAVGEDSSAVGLTAGINIDKDGVKRITPGVCGLADNGVAIIDELEKRETKDFRRLSVPMDDNQQMIIRKAGLHRPIQARCAHLHIGNPIGSGKWDPTKTIEEQTDFAIWLIRRYDFIFIVYDRHDSHHNEQVIDYIGKTLSESSYEEITSKLSPEQAQSRIANEISGNFFTPAYLRHEFKYVKKINPILDTGKTSKTWHMIKEFWMRMKMMKLYNPNYDPEDKVNQKKYDAKRPQNITAMDVRGIYSMVRVSRAIARIYRSPIVEPKHVERAIKLFKYTITCLQPQELREGANAVSDEGNGHGLKVTTIQRDITKMAMRDKSEQDKQFLRKYVKMVEQVAKAIFKESFIKCGNKDCRGGQVVEVTDPVMHTKRVRKCGDCEGTAGDYQKFTYNDVERNLVEPKIMSSKHVGMMWKIFKRAGVIDHARPGSKEYVVIKDPRDPDFVDTITAITAEEPKSEEDQSIPTMNRYTILDDELESEEEEPAIEIQIEEYPKMHPTGKSDIAAEKYILRELAQLDNKKESQAEEPIMKAPFPEEKVAKLNDEELNEIDLGDATESNPE